MKVPAFMRGDIPITAPELDVDALVVGSPVVVTPVQYRAREKAEKVPAQVTGKARVWVQIAETGVQTPRTWRMRLDTQDEGDRMYSQYNSQFRTPEQEIHHTAYQEAAEYLREQGISLIIGSPWTATNWNTIRLARMIWRAENGD